MDASAAQQRPDAAPTEGTASSAGMYLLVENRWLVLVLGLTLLAYAGTFGFQFVSDDDFQIVNNRFVTSWQYVPRFFTEHAWSHSDPNAQGNYYRPIALLWLFANHLLFGLNPSWWHVTTVLLHLAATTMVYVLIARIVNDRLTAGFAALIFGLHPVHIEAVAWVSGFTEPLLAVLFITAFLFYLNGRQMRNAGLNRGWLALSLISYALALLTKETAIILPVFIAAYEWIFVEETDGVAGSERNRIAVSLKFYGRTAKTALVRVVPFLAMTVVYLVARAIVLKGLSHAARSVSLSTAFLTWPSMLWFYIKHLVWPVRLSGFYDTPFVRTPGFYTFIFPTAAVASVVAGLWLSARRSTKATRRAIGFAAALMVLPILPLLNLSIFREGELVHDRYLYLPSIGFSMLLAMGIARVRSGQRKLFDQPALQVLAAIVLTGALGLATALQHVNWASDILLYQHSLSVAPNNNIAANNLANELSRRGLYDDAIAIYQQAAERSPNEWAVVYNLGCNYYLLGKYEEARSHLMRGVEMRPAEPKQYLTLAATLEQLNRLADAERAIRRGLEFQPDGSGFHFELGDILNAQGRLREALDEFRAEVGYNPDGAKARARVADIEARLAQAGPRN
jgi:protein O-mannosyl-transferase